VEKAASKAEAAHEVAGLSYDVFELAAVRRRVKDEDTLGDVHHTTAQRAVCFARSEPREEGHAGHDRATKAAKHRWRYAVGREETRGEASDSVLVAMAFTLQYDTSSGAVSRGMVAYPRFPPSSSPRRRNRIYFLN